jgi:ankyrin repeat protein
VQQVFRFISKFITSALEKGRKEERSDAGNMRLPLIAAVRSGNTAEVARLLMRPAADVNVRDKDGRTLLHSLVPELVKLTDSEKIPLYDCIALLLAAGADINAGDNYGNTPLTDAVKLGDVKTVEFLLKNGADANARDNNGKTPLHEFFFVSGPLFIKHINREVDLTQIEGCIAEMLVRNGADVNAVDKQGRTPLAMAAGVGNMKAVEFLLNNRADVNARDNDGMTPLHMINTVVGDRSTPGQITKIAEMLIQNGADVNARDHKQQTPLFFSRIDAIDALIAAGADVNARDKEGKTPIFCVKSRKCLDTLIEKGADIEAVDAEGKRYCQ